MVFWRKQKNAGTQEKEHHDDRLLHHKNDPDLEPATEYDSEMDEATKARLRKSEEKIIDELEPMPVPEHTPNGDSQEAEDLSDHTNEGGWLSRLTKGLSKSSNKLGQSITDVFTKRKLDETALEELEEILITADIGLKTAAKLVADFSENRFDKEVRDFEVHKALAESIAGILEPVAKPLDIAATQAKPFVMLVCGVNGAGKTTTIGKMAHDYHVKQHKSVMIAAGDTFRAAAVEQLDVWAKRAHVPLIKKEIGADSAAVAYEAYEKAKAENVDVLMIDTAGRLQNKANLMEELAKMIRVIKKQDESAPHAVILVLDSTTGQNAHSQVQNFKDVVDVTGLVVTKLDGSAKGGVVVSLAEEFGLPIHAVGVGEKIEDLSPFSAKDFANALMGLSS
ncbi:MAG: signal recognition particle-docking protein FtsY [Alphaproteobacteria bacterium]